MLLLASLAGSASASVSDEEPISEEGGCPVAYEDDPFPPMRIETTFVGFTDQSYSRTDLPTPGPIPLGIYATDYDSRLVHCGDLCVPIFFGTPVNGHWAAYNDEGTDAGTFLKADATQVTELADTMRVLYLPPNDLQPGESRTCTVTATACDECGVPDPVATVDFTVDVKRLDTGYFDVEVTRGTPDNPDFEPKPCAGDATPSGNCDLLTNKQVPPPPSVTLTAPNATLVGELRPLGCTPIDYDYIIGECGTPPGVQPVVHNGVTVELCDGFFYKWEVVPVPGNTGTGYFLGEHSRTPLFGALTPGSVTVRVTATAFDGETATAQTTFNIFKPVIKRLEYDSTWDVDEDLTGNPYAPPHWEDINDNGHANDQGDRHFPVAYKANEDIDLAQLDVSTPIRPMPGDALTGSVNGESGRSYIAYSLQYDPSVISGHWKTSTIRTYGAPFNVSRYFDPYQIDWQCGVLMNSSGSVPIGSTDNKLYVVMGAPFPNADFARKSHTTFELACRSNDNITGVPTLRANIWNELSPADVERENTDGFNNPVPMPHVMTYWEDPLAPCQTATKMLQDGDGSCAAWSQLLIAAFSLQGVPSKNQILLPGPTTPSTNGAVIMKSWTPSGIPGSNLLQFYVHGQSNAYVTDNTGLAAKGVDNPGSKFAWHLVVVSEGVMYAPSYIGSMYPNWAAAATRIQWENVYLHGTCLNATVGGATVVLNNPNALDLSYLDL